MDTRENANISSKEALSWLRAYHQETLTLAQKIASKGSEIARISHDIYAVPEQDRPVQRERYQKATTEYEALCKKLNDRCTE